MKGWSHIVRLSELARGPVSVRLEPDAGTRKQIAKTVNLEQLHALSGQLTVRPWLDGAEISGRFKATVEQVCSVTADNFEQDLFGEIELRVVPAGSPNTPTDSGGGDVMLDLDAPDPPDVLEDEEIDLAHYLVEALSLEIDPFPRKPGAEFDYKPETQEESPFAVLKRLKDEGE
jgi:hypothetical protein